MRGEDGGTGEQYEGTGKETKEQFVTKSCSQVGGCQVFRGRESGEVGEIEK